jgi:hypothetical protein
MKKSNSCPSIDRLFQAHKSVKKIQLIILGLMVAAGLTRVQAQLIDVNFIDASISYDYGGAPIDPPPSAMSGAAVLGSAGDVWNGLGGFAYNPYPNNATYTSGNLLFVNGGVSGVTLTLSAPSGTYDANSAGFGNHSPFSWTSLANETGNIGYPYTPYAKLMASCLVANTTAAVGSVTLNGLTPNALYNVYTYNASDQNETAGRTSTFTINGATQTSTYDGVTTNLVEGVDYLIFAGVAASASGTLTIDFGGMIASESDFNGFQIEPANGAPPPPPPPPTLSTISPNAIILCTNADLTCTATTSSNTISITNVQLILTTSTLGGIGSTTVTNTLTSPAVIGLGTPSASVSYPLASNLIYTVTVVATDSNGNSKSGSATFDTLAPALVIEAEDFNYSGGAFLDTPPNGGLALFANAPLGVSEIDYQKNLANGSQGADGSYYRSGDVIINGYANPVNGTAQKYVTAAANGDTVDVPIEVGYNGVGDWLDYTRTFATNGSAASGTYDIWARLATDGSGAALNFSQVTGGQDTTSQTTSLLGSFTFTDNNWNGFDYVPLLDQFGNLVSTTLSGQQTLRSTVTGNPNIDFYMLVPSTPKLTPSLLFAYPDGVHPFEATNNLSFTVGPANGSNIPSSGVHLVVNGVDVTASPKFTLTQSGTKWTGNYPVSSNAPYAAVINVTNSAGLFSTFSITFDTFNINNYQWEAVDYDFSTNDNMSTPPQQGGEFGPGWYSGLFIDNPVPTADTTGTTAPAGTYETNSYFGYPTGFTAGNDPFGAGALAQQGVDINFGNSGQGGSGTEIYRSGDGVGAQAAADYVRPKFLVERTNLNDPNIGPINIGYYAAGYWLNYTRHYPTNNYYVWGRLAGGAGPFSGTTMSILTSGYATGTQTSNVLGTFSDPNAAGWQSWHWIPLLDANSNMVNVQLGGLATLKVTSGNNINTEFFMLAPAPPIFKVTPSLVGGLLNLAFPTEIGHNYTVVYKGSLTVSSWTPVGSVITGNGSVTNVTETLTGTQGYYTVITQ